MGRVGQGAAPSGMHTPMHTHGPWHPGCCPPTWHHALLVLVDVLAALVDHLCGHAAQGGRLGAAPRRLEHRRVRLALQQAHGQAPQGRET